MASTEAEQLADGWDEERCIAALAQLERLQAQLDDLRLTIPRVVEPFNSGLTSGPVIFKQFRQATVGSQNDIKAFRAQWQGQDIQSIFEYTRESLGKNSDLSTSAQVPIYGWVETEIIDKEAARRRRPGARKDESHISLEKNEIARTLEEFRKTHPNITVAAKEGNQDVLIKLATGDLKLKNVWGRLSYCCQSRDAFRHDLGQTI
ncbi:hypothetical protein CC78DRAFT_582373 [Lojkania enalia]|uniref:Uncharacterized protein n=1 Tax=Lojkania enalia TaxID=147567 RepID=A0A9P4MYJ5_9PLEO|nr:hypothetical protein CC78DRAFT_582373 [Didymosphaeria enalia]